MKKRSRNASVGNAGVTAVRRYCDCHDLIFQGEPREDFGIDCYIEVEIASSPQNFLIGLQVKSGASHRQDRQDGTFSLRVRPDDAQYWLAANYPVLLVYLHDQEERLYFRHVQAGFSDAASLTECTSLLFTETDIADDGRMAEYVRMLARTTPSVLSRFRVLSETAILTVGKRDTVLQETAPTSEVVSFQRFRSSGHEDPESLFPPHSRTLGYSADDRWLCELRVPDEPPSGYFDVEVAFVNLEAYALYNIRLLTANERIEASRTGKPFDWENYNETIDRLDYLSNLLGIQPARTLYDGYALMFQPDAHEQIQLSFGGEVEFSLSVGAYQGRDTLMLRSDQFEPPRTAHLLLERPPFALLSTPGETRPKTIDKLQQTTKAPRFEYVTGVTVSPSGDLTTFAVMTNATHSCWGARSVHLAHIRVEELRRICADSLRF